MNSKQSRSAFLKEISHKYTKITANHQPKLTKTYSQKKEIFAKNRCSEKINFTAKRCT